MRPVRVGTGIFTSPALAENKDCSDFSTGKMPSDIMRKTADQLKIRIGDGRDQDGLV